MKKIVKVLFLSFLLMSFILTGCQSIGTSTIDLNQMMNNETLPNTSMKLRESVTLHLNYDETMVNPEDLPYYKLLDGSKIDYFLEMQEDTLKLEGNISLYKGDFPFKIFVSPNEMILWIDNAVKPIVIRDETKEEIENEILSSYRLALGELYDEQNKEASTQLIDFVIENLPNPNTISYNLSERTTINNEEVYLNKINAKVSLDEIPSLIIDFLNNVKEDQKLKEILKVIYQAYELDTDYYYPEDSWLTPEQHYDHYIEESYQDILGFIDEIIPEIEQSVATGDWEFGKDSYLETSLYIDQSMKVKKGDTNVNFVLPESKVESSEGFLGFNLQMNFERYDINKVFDVLPFDLSGKEVIQSDSTDEEILDSFNKDGVFYDILKNDFKVIPIKTTVLTLGKKEVEIKEEGKNEAAKSLDVAPYTENGTTLVPVRFVTEELGATVRWDEKTKKITIIKDDTTVVLVLNSNVATVNGMNYYLSANATTKNYTTMVPLRFISEVFDADIKWNGELKTITIKQYK